MPKRLIKRLRHSSSSVGVKLKLMFVEECATKPYFKIRRCARVTNSNKTEVGVEAAQLTGAQIKNEAKKAPSLWSGNHKKY